MSKLQTKDIDTALANFSPADAAIEGMASRYLPLRVDGIKDKDGLAAVREARRDVRDHRIRVEKTRKELKADALEYGRRVDAEAKRITALLEPIESHLDAEVKLVEAEQARLAAEREAKKRAALDARMSRLAQFEFQAVPSEVEALDVDGFKALLEKAEAEFMERKEREAAEARAEAERQAAIEAERQRMEAERAELDRQQKLAEQARLEVERQKAEIAAEREKLEREKQLEAAKALAAEKAAKDERERIEREAAAKAAAEKAAKAEAERLEALLPTKKRLMDYAASIRAAKNPFDGQIASRVSAILNEAAGKIEQMSQEIK